ncbi:hypothetical protein ACFRAE_07465 [Sphingobacterium sp. HJSM2_6]|uniref:hypothetical protein n=1 Tax=Sphingobacterium sp. HJSM2_6 TaxID=3366264 RepID=UPI003BD27B1F
MKTIYNIIIAILVITGLSACKKEYYSLYKDNKPEIPVTYEGARTAGFNPYIEIPATQNNISVTLLIPETSGRKIKEISKVEAGSTAINANGARKGKYISSAIAGQGNKVTFSTTLSSFKAYSPNNEKLIADFMTNAKANELQIAFMFLIKLDNDQEIIPVQLRVVLKK